MTRIKYQPEQREKRIPKGHKPGCLCRACAGTRGESIPTEQLGIRISPELSKELRDRAQAENKTITEATIEAIETWLRK